MSVRWPLGVAESASASTRRGRSARNASGTDSTCHWGLQHLGQAGLEGAEVEAVGVVEQGLEGDAVGVRAEAVAVGAGAHHGLEHPLGRVLGDHQVDQIGDGLTLGDTARLGGPAEHPVEDQAVDDGGVGGGAHAAEHQGEAGEDGVLGQLLGGFGGQERRASSWPRCARTGW